jgi:hypothetical protein
MLKALKKARGLRFGPSQHILLVEHTFVDSGFRPCACDTPKTAAGTTASLFFPSSPRSRTALALVAAGCRMNTKMSPEMSFFFLQPDAIFQREHAFKNY